MTQRPGILHGGEGSLETHLSLSPASILGKAKPQGFGALLSKASWLGPSFLVASGSGPQSAFPLLALASLGRGQGSAPRLAGRSA